jgi:hypothetical protein
LQLPADALDPAQQAALIRVTGATITFRHPSALYQSATLSQRQRVRAALASALAGEENTDRRVWHQAMATLTGDEEGRGAGGLRPPCPAAGRPRLPRSPRSCAQPS